MSNIQSDSEIPEKILDKIKKCLALSESSNANEANIALRQARKLMDQYKVESDDIAAFNATEHVLDVGKRPSNWAISLGSICAEAFACAVVACKHQTHKGIRTELRFIGVGSYPELAKYAYDVLLRQLIKARKVFVSSLDSRCKLATKRRRGDIFANAWISSVYQLIAEFSGCDEDSIEAINAFKKINYPDLKQLEMKNRKISRRDHHAKIDGYKQGKNATLFKSVNKDSKDGIEGNVAIGQLALL